MSHPYQPYQQPGKAPAKRKPPRGLMIVLYSILGILSLVLLFAAFGALVGGNEPTKTTPPANQEADPAKDLGAGEPGANCATDRLGKSFTKDGIRYTCKGPKPYRWLPD